MNKGLIALVVVLVTILALPLVYSAFRGGGGVSLEGFSNELALPSATVELEYDRIRAAGLPITPAELDAWYETPADNAAPLYTIAFDQFVPLTDDEKPLVPFEGDAKLPLRREPLTQEMRAAMAAFLKRNASPLSLLHEGASREGCRYPVDFSVGYEVELPHLSKVRGATRLLCIEAALRADSGDGPGAADSLASALAMARSLRTEPCLISQLVRYACLGIGVEALDWVVNRTPLADSGLEALAGMLASAEEHRGLWHGAVGERAMIAFSWDSRLGAGADSIVNALGSDLPKGLTAAQLRAYASSPEFDDDLMCALTMLDGLIRASKLPPEEGRALGEVVGRMHLDMPEDYLVCQISVSALARIHMARERVSAQCRTAIAGLAVARYAGANGSLPDSLDQLVPQYFPAVPLDPYDSQPLRYKKEAGKGTVYSISKNLTDDGGRKSATVKDAWESGDLTFVVEP